MTIRPERASAGLRRAPRLAALTVLLSIGLAGCVEKGDFGRVRTDSTWNDIVGATGSVAATMREEAVSPFRLTDDETELRDRAWRFLVPAHDRNWFETALAELVATRVLPDRAQTPDPTSYFRSLEGEGARSPASRYRRLSEDAAADARLLPAFVDVAARVITADRIRLKTLGHAGLVTAADLGGAQNRVIENRCLLAWVATGLDRRRLSYGYALEHLVIETPQADAVPAERSLGMLGAARTSLDTLGVSADMAAECGRPGETPRVGRSVAPPLVRKG